MTVAPTTSLVQRWLVVCGTRVVYTNPQHTYATADEARHRRDVMLRENPMSKLESVFGKNPSFDVRAYSCKKLESGGYEPVCC